MTKHHLKLKNGAAILSAALAAFFVIADCPAQGAPETNQNVGILTPGPNDGRIAYVTADLMENVQFDREPLDTARSENFFTNYINTLDPRHENFLQSDISSFDRYRTNLDAYTLGGNERADLTPAFEIFARFKERLSQHAAYAQKLLKEDDFKFNRDENINLDRRDAAWPTNMLQAQQFWKKRLRYEFLQEKLGRELVETNNSEIVVPLPEGAETNIIDRLSKHYGWTSHMLTNWDSDNVLQAYLNALVHTYDPHSDYLNSEHAQNFSIEMSLSLFGIGAQLTEQDGYCTINALIPGGPAEKSNKIHPQDRIVAVAQSNQPPVNVVDVELSKVVEMIRGAKGTQVRLTVLPGDGSGEHVVTLVREEIKLQDQEAKAKLIVSPDGSGGTNRIGVINVPSFYAPIGVTNPAAQNFVSVDVAKLIKKLKAENANGIILDLRNNPGGSLEEAIRFTGLFIKDGPVVQAKSPDGRIQVDEDSDPEQLYSGPLIVLVNRFSASASEIAAAALQDYGRAIIVGDTNTFGKGTVQTVTSLRPFVWPATPTATNDPGEVKITIRKFYRITGASTQLRGVLSDIVLPDVLNHSTDIGEKALDNPLPYDTISGRNYQKLDLVQPYLDELRRRSEARVATNQDFEYIRQDIAEFKKLQADKTATLDEQKALEERKENAEKDQERAAERAKRPIPNEEIYDITVENADQPGLPSPEPLTATNYESSASLTNNLETNTVARINKAFGVLTNLIGSNAPAMASGVVVTNRVSSGETGAAENIHQGKPTIVNAVPADPMLDETENILEDYITLLSSNKTLIVNQGL